MEGDDDEEEDISKMDLGKKNKLRRREFASEEAWSSYNDKREALPKAAFQFGVKMSDGRKTRSVILFQIANICAAKTKARIRRRNSIKS
jgi:hypothetical protein